LREAFYHRFGPLTGFGLRRGALALARANGFAGFVVATCFLSALALVIVGSARDYFFGQHTLEGIPGSGRSGGVLFLSSHRGLGHGRGAPLIFAPLATNLNSQWAFSIDGFVPVLSCDGGKLRVTQ
jgi:hypothetical protein